MPHHDTDIQTTLLHIGAIGAFEVEQMTERLCDLPVRVRDCSNVYQGLARLCIAGADLPGAVLVSVDAMDASELEFFRLVARMFPTLPVYVYGGTSSCARIDRAIELGARDRATDGVLAELCRARPVPRAVVESEVGHAAPPCAAPVADAPTPVSDSPEPPRQEHVSSESPVDLESDLEALAEADESDDALDASMEQVSDALMEDLEDDGEVGEVRVPWLTYKDAPVRRGPNGAEPRRSGESSPPPQRIVRRSEPLLSDEELRALLDGDDMPPAKSSTPPRRDASS